MECFSRLKKHKGIVSIIAVVVVLAILVGVFQSKSLIDVMNANDLKILRNAEKCIVISNNGDSMNNNTLEDIDGVIKSLEKIQVRWVGFHNNSFDVPINTSIYHIYLMNDNGRDFEITYTIDGRLYYGSKSYSVLSGKEDLDYLLLMEPM